jgi:hypothetical protein
MSNLNWFRRNIEQIEMIEMLDMDREFNMNDMSSAELTEKKNWFGEMVNIRDIQKIAIEMKGILKNSFVFNVPLNLSRILTHTKPDFEDKIIKLPYSAIFINSNIMETDSFTLGGVLSYKKENKTILKTFLQDNRLSESERKGAYHVIKFEIVDGKTDFNEIIRDSKETLFTKMPIENKDLRDVLAFFFNFIDFLNNPEIEFVQKKENYPANTIKNNSAGAYNIYVSGKLKIYVDRITSLGSETIRRAHWVRGHWRRFIGQRYCNMRGKKVWVYPFIKGYGNPNKKEYFLANKLNGGTGKIVGDDYGNKEKDETTKGD